MFYLVPGFSVLMLSIGISSQLFLKQQQMFQNLNYPNRGDDCDDDEIMVGDLPFHKPVERSNTGCFLPDLAVHHGDISPLARNLIYLAIDHCRQEQCHEH
jgi:hypothetical protein